MIPCSVTTSTPNVNVGQPTTWDSLIQAEKFRVAGNFAEANAIYSELLKVESHSPAVLLEIDTRIIQMQFGRVVSELNDKGDRVDNVYYSVAENYQLKMEDQKQFLQMSANNKTVHAKTHFELATLYRESKFSKNTQNNSFSYLLGDWIFSEGKQEYAQALCITHLKIASELGLAKASFELIKIYKEAKYLLPAENRQVANTKKINDSIAISYAQKAEGQAIEQRDRETLLKLGAEYEHFGRDEDSKRCYQNAAELGHRKMQ